jgi:signal transduction protein with GAF and PtsI domain
MSLQTGEKTLQQIVSTVSSSLELTEVLRAVVRLMSDASGVHACFAYLLEDDRLVLRAASPPYEKQAGKVVMERGEGLAWWAAERGEPAFIRDNALADPRTKYFPELEEERFQSLVCVPMVGKDGNVIGVISSHTKAPREFTEREVEVLVDGTSKRNPGELSGRTRCNRVVNFEGGRVAAGDVVTVRVTDVMPHSLRATLTTVPEEAVCSSR